MELEPFLAMARENPEGILILADWLEEQGYAAECDGLRRGIILPEFMTNGNISNYGYRYYITNGDGYMYDHSYLNGYGDGDGYGDGCNNGYGNGNGYGHDQEFTTPRTTMDELEIGQAYLWMTSDGWMWVARFVRRDGLFGVVVKDRVNVCRTGGTPWADLCLGKGRREATFKAWPDVTKSGAPFPYAVPFAKWEGEYPKG